MASRHMLPLKGLIVNEAKSKDVPIKEKVSVYYTDLLFNVRIDTSCSPKIP